MKLVHIVGARPNFMKVAPVMAALSRKSSVSQTLIHTGQHYDENMSNIFFRQLDIPEPDVNLEIGSGSHAVQTANIMIRFEEVVSDNRPDLVLVYGDVNSTVATALVCAKLHIPVGHVEAGLRSFDRQMPEEINRLITDQIADHLFTPSADGNENLMREGIKPDKIHLVGNVMIDTLTRLLPRAVARWEDVSTRLSLTNGTYGLVTLHRPSNVDDPEHLREIVTAMKHIGERLPLVFPVHPRTRNNISSLGITTDSRQIRLVDPIGYLDFLALQQHAKLVITDSGGVQEETTYLGKPCLTMRENTERPVTMSEGTNTLIGRDTTRLKASVETILNGSSIHGRIPELWDGRAGERIADIIAL